MSIKLKNLLLKTWPVIIILSLILVILKQNYIPNTQLLGWDNLVPEFNFGANIQRSVFAVWQEYQGLGLLGGMGHASDLVHQLILLALSFILPLDLLRYSWIFLMLFTGSVGAYLLIKKAILASSPTNSTKMQIIALLGGIFYLLNLSTVQTFYAPFEAFIAHFAALPWFLLMSLFFYQKPNKKNGLLLALVLFIGTPANYIPTLFVVHFISLTILIGILALSNRQKENIKSALKLFFIIFTVNVFWLLPFIYFLFTNSNVALDAKINQMSTETVFLQNKAFGDLKSVILLKGFWLNNVDPNLKGSFAYMLTPWKQYLSNPLIENIGYLFFSVILLGLISALKSRKTVQLVFGIIFILCFSMLAINTPPFSFLDTLLRKLPLLNEVLRFPYTKFSILLSLAYAIFFTLGIEILIKYLSRFIKSEKINLGVLSLVFFILLIIFSFPIFQGHLFYSKEKIVVPKEYFQVFDYFKNQDQNTRIANFPQYTFWGWNFYTWGYGGSGFLWYGIKQPILDRAFDVWSSNDENYYWELSSALYSKDLQAFENVLNKYQVDWLLVDKNVINPSSSKALFIPELNSLISHIHSIQKTKSFGNIDIYQVNLKDNPKNFVFTATNLKSANSYHWGNLDKAYFDLGNYISSNNSDYFYPFRSLFSNKNQNDHEFQVTNESNFLTFSSNLTTNSNITLNIPKYDESETIIPVNIVSEKSKDNSLTLSLLLQTPEISIIKGKDSRIIYSQNIKTPIFSLTQSYLGQINININGIGNFSTYYTQGARNIGSGFLSLKQDNLITISNPKPEYLQTKIIKPTDIASLFNTKNIAINLNVDKNSIIKVRVPKINNAYASFEEIPSKDLISQVKNCDNFNKGQFSSSLKENMLELESQNSTPCISFYMPTLSHDQGYALFIDSINRQGRGLHTWLLNEDEKFSPIDTYLGKETTSTFIIPPQDSFGRAYSLHFDNISITNDKTINDLGNISLYSIPYNFLTSIKIAATKIATDESFVNQNLYVNHPNEGYYEVAGIAGEKTLILSQSYNRGWHAYALKSKNILNKLIPFLGEKELKNHVLINNWENGWVLDSKIDKNTQIIIVYLPQYLEYFGIILTLLTFLIVIAINVKTIHRLRHRN